MCYGNHCGPFTRIYVKGLIKLTQHHELKKKNKLLARLKDDSNEFTFSQSQLARFDTLGTPSPILIVNDYILPLISPHKCIRMKTMGMRTTIHSKWIVLQWLVYLRRVHELCVVQGKDIIQCPDMNDIITFDSWFADHSSNLSIGRSSADEVIFPWSRGLEWKSSLIYEIWI
jgi:hypothetical protein